MKKPSVQQYYCAEELLNWVLHSRPDLQNNVDEWWMSMDSSDGFKDLNDYREDNEEVTDFLAEEFPNLNEIPILLLVD